MDRINLGGGTTFSRIIHGHWRLAGWNMSARELSQFIMQTIEAGVTSFDHADIYGNYGCEVLFGNALRLDKGLRPQIEIITKCGIKLLSDKFPGRRVKHYDYSFDHIVASVDNSLKNLGTGYIDLLLLHRPAPFIDPEEVARAFSHLEKNGKVLHFGVSNFTPQQFGMLNSYAENKLVTNQVELSPYCLDHFENGNIDYFLQHKIKPMAWSPLAGGRLMNPQDEKGRRLQHTLSVIAEELNVSSIDQVVYAWILKHPAGILPVVGTGKIEHILNAAGALNIDMTLEQWYKIYTASTGMDVP